MRRLRAVPLTAALLLSCLSSAEPAAKIEVRGYEIAIRADEPDTLVSIVAELALRLQPPVERIEFLFASRASGLVAEAVGAPQAVPLEVRRAGGDSLGLALPPPLQKADSLRLRLRYALPRRPLPGATYLSRGHRWYPQIIDQIAPYRLAVDLPREWTSVSGGDLVEDSPAGTRRRMTWESAMPVFKIELMLAQSTARRDAVLGSGGVAFHFVSSRSDSAAATEILREATRAFAYFRNLLGDYPYRRLTIIETDEWPGTNIGSGIVVAGRQAVDAFLAGNKDELRLAMACQWIGAGAFPKFLSPGFWFLQLSLPHYLRLMYVKEADGERAFANQMEQGLAAYQRFAGTDEDVAINDIALLDTRAKGAAIYGKGPYLVDVVARGLGDGPWRQALAALFRSYRGKSLTCADLCVLLDERDPAHELGSRLARMLSRKGLPGSSD